MILRGSQASTVPPLGLVDVLSPTLLVVGIGSLSLVAAGSLVDSVIERRWRCAALAEPAPGNRRGADRPRWRGLLPGHAVAQRRGRTLGTPRDRAILTPECSTTRAGSSWLQLALAAMLLFRPIVPTAALEPRGRVCGRNCPCGIFHMIDYAFFAGLAAYLALSGPYFDRRPELRNGVSRSGRNRGLQPDVDRHPKASLSAMDRRRPRGSSGVTMGFPASFVTVAAAFVEISVAFYLLVGRTLLRV